MPFQSLNKIERYYSCLIPKLTLSIAICFVLNSACSTNVLAEKKYIFKQGSRQAIEVNTDTRSDYHRRYPQSRVVRQGMSRRRVPSPKIGPQSNQAQSSREKRSYHFTCKVKVDNHNRKFVVYVPKSYSRTRSVPLLLVFHGLGMNATSMTAVTGFNGVASRNNFIVAYCQAVKGKWNDGMRNAQGVSDVKYVKAVIKSLNEKLSIDNRRIYACGLSNGGYFCQLLASAMPNTIKGISVVGSTVMSQALTSATNSKPIPCVFFLGSNDPLVSWGDGKSRSLGKYGKKLGLKSIDPKFLELARYGGWMNVGDMVNYWTTRNRCNSSPVTRYLPDKDRSDGMRVRLEAYGSRGNAVYLYIIEGGSHSWPGALQLPGVKTKSCQDISASELIWDFFQRYAR